MIATVPEINLFQFYDYNSMALVNADASHNDNADASHNDSADTSDDNVEDSVSTKDEQFESEMNPEGIDNNDTNDGNGISRVVDSATSYARFGSTHSFSYW